MERVLELLYAVADCDDLMRGDPEALGRELPDGIGPSLGKYLVVARASTRELVFASTCQETLGAGGFGITYRAQHESLTWKSLAIKEYSPRVLRARWNVDRRQPEEREQTLTRSRGSPFNPGKSTLPPSSSDAPRPLSISPKPDTNPLYSGCPSRPLA